MRLLSVRQISGLPFGAGCRGVPELQACLCCRALWHIGQETSARSTDACARSCQTVVLADPYRHYRQRCIGLTDIQQASPRYFDGVRGPPTFGGPMPTKQSRLRVCAFHYQGGRCYYCDAPMWQSNPEQFAKTFQISQAQARRFQCTAEHLRARQDAGPNTRNNIVAACRYCNETRHRRRNNDCAATYKQFVRRRLSRRQWHPHWVFERGLCRTNYPTTHP